MKLRKLRTVATLGLLASIVVLSVGCPPTADGTGIVIFRDSVLEGIVRFQLGLPLSPFITQTDLLALTRLEARFVGIRDLQGLQFALNLTHLDLQGNAISDIGALTNLINLSFLNLAENQISDIVPLAGLFNLDELALHENDIVNISPLVANSENGGLGPGDSVTLNPDTIFDMDGNTSVIIAEQLTQLAANGVDVVFLVPDSASGS